MGTKPQDSPKVPEAAIEALAEMRWNEGRNPDADSPRWDELVGCEDMKRRYCDEARADLEELAPFIFSALLSDEAIEASARVFAKDMLREDWSSLDDGHRANIVRQHRKYLQAAVEQVGGAERG